MKITAHVARRSVYANYHFSFLRLYYFTARIYTIEKKNKTGYWYSFLRLYLTTISALLPLIVGDFPFFFLPLFSIHDRPRYHFFFFLIPNLQLFQLLENFLRYVNQNENLLSRKNRNFSVTNVTHSTKY